MKKITTLAFMAFFVCLGAMAQVELGDIHFSIANGKKVNPNNGKITVTFPNVTGVEDPTATTFVLEGNFGNEDLAFDGVEAAFRLLTLHGEHFPAFHYSKNLCFHGLVLFVSSVVSVSSLRRRRADSPSCGACGTDG